MKLTGFRIRNYRSIIDSGWIKLSDDNISVLIGQNESGKSSILHALKNFYDANISMDIIRSDYTMPEISCSFKIEIEPLKKRFPGETFPPTIERLYKEGKEEIRLKRSWTTIQENTLALDEGEFKHAFDQFFEEWREQNTNEAKKLEGLSEEYNELIQTLSALETKHNEDQKRFREVQSLVKKSKGKEKDELEQERKNLLDKIETNNKEIHTLNKKLLRFNELIKLTDEYRLANNELKRFEQSEKQLSDEIISLQKKISQYPGKRKFAKRLKQQEKDMASLVEAKKEAISRVEIILRISEKIFHGISDHDARKQVANEYIPADEFLNSTKFTQEIAKHLPYFDYFEDYTSLLPNEIDLEEIINNNQHVEGFKAVKNFFIVAGLDFSFFRQNDFRIEKRQITEINHHVSSEFQSFWRQKVDQKNKINIQFELKYHDSSKGEKSGKPYLAFWVVDGRDPLYPKQRSRGVRWFISFYLQLLANAKSSKGKNRILLIDEPGISLHARAQEDVLKVFEETKEKIQIIYSTHSPYLIDLNKIYRLLAVQRENSEDDLSETKILESEKICAASPDTLSPVYSIMGINFSNQHIIPRKNNVLVQDLKTFYYIKAFMKLCNSKMILHFMPATEVYFLPQLANLFLGWGLEFHILGIGNKKSYDIVFDNLKMNFAPNGITSDRKVIIEKKFRDIEDIFTKTDFKKYVLKDRLGITQSNSEFLEENKYQQDILALHFHLDVQNSVFQFFDLDQGTQTHIELLVEEIEKLYITN